MIRRTCSSHNRNVSLYFKVFETGKLDTSSISLLLPQAPPGDEFSPHVFLEDIFDGTEGAKTRKNKSKNGKKNNVGGLGILTDALFGDRILFADHGIQKGESINNDEEK